MAINLRFANMRRVYICSPCRGQVEVNRRYLDQCLRDSIKRGEAPFAPHAYLPLILNDNDITQRRQALEIGMKYLLVSQLIAVYTDYGISDGMQGEMDQARANKIRIELRKLQ